MAIATGTLTVKITETISLNGMDHGGTTTETIDSIGQVYKRIVSIPVDDGSTGANDQYSVITTTDDSTTTVGPGRFISTDIKYIRITNLNTGAGEGLHVYISRDNDNDGTADETAVLLLEEGKSFMLWATDAAFDAAAAGITAASLDGISDIKLKNESTSVVVDAEVFVVSA
tara:strand:+ start:3516 stop:4031 length:516 start_codon:yes stop_codon:yes gene_type:complete